ncbi:MAG: hypothetical protein JNN00_07425 [Chitinophagaceae bacterium]|nr:hypothetical protein [Chitinophagaceae bacterium]
MKRVIHNNRIVVIAFFTVFSVASLTASANGSKTLPIELKYTGHVNNQPLYKLIVKGNAEPDEFTISIRDSKGNILFRENIKGESFTKSFLLNTEEMGDDDLHFEISSKKTKKLVTYEINRHSHLVEEAVIEPK